MKRLGAVSLAAFAIHAAVHVHRGAPEELLWMCNVAALLVAAGLLSSRPLPVAIGISWLLAGNVLWLLALAMGGELLPTSLLTHVLCLVLGVLGVRRLGFPRGAWIRALLAVIALQILSRLITPARANVNLAFGIHPGWESVFPTPWAYHLTLIALGAASFAAVEATARRLLADPARPSIYGGRKRD